MLLGGVGLGWRLAQSNVLGGLPTANPVQLSPQASPSSNGQSSQGLNAQQVAAKVEKAVVDINTVVQSSGGQGEAAGTGMILTSSGEVLTNNHVVEGSTSISVTIPGRSGSYQATVLGVDPSADVALIKIQGVSGLPTVHLADSSSLTVGEAVVAIGNAGGVGGAPTVTQGSITALNQSITASDALSAPEQLSGLIQTDAPIQAGDSGGPLANAAGQVVGMITAGQTQDMSQQSSNIGFAIPASTAAGIVDQIERGQASSTVFIGQTGFLGVGVRDNGSGGALVTNVVSGSPADQAGITPGSVITQVDGTQISSASSLSPAIQGHKPGQSIQVTWTDPNGGSQTASVTLTSGPVA